MNKDILMKRIWTKVVEEDGHWLWLGEKIWNGYGRLTIKGKHKLAHRVAYEITFGPIPKGLTIDHLCRRRDCIRPSHLEAVSMRENILRGIAPTAENAKKKMCKYGHAMFVERKDRPGTRECQACQRIKNRNRWRRSHKSATWRKEGRPVDPKTGLLR